MPTVSTAEFCAACIRPSSELKPFRLANTPAHHVTPVFCPACWPGRRGSRTQAVMGLRDEEAENFFRRQGDEDRVRPLQKLLRKTCPAYSPAPQFTPNTIHDAYADMTRHGEYKGRTQGWRFVNGVYERIE